MASSTIDLLPGDSELARRAAGGDGAAFVRLYDHYSADLFEATLAATGSVERAADATQAAFLELLRRPPAIDAPDHEVIERLRALALGAGASAVPVRRDRPEGLHAPAGAGVGWLRSETVAKAGEGFDEDWSVYLDPAVAATAAGVAHSRGAAPDPLPPLVREAEPKGPPAPPARVSPPAPAPRRRWRPAPALPSTAALAAVVALAVFAAALSFVIAGGGDDAGAPATDAASGPAAAAADASGDPANTGARDRRPARRARDGTAGLVEALRFGKNGFADGERSPRFVGATGGGTRGFEPVGNRRRGTRQADRNVTGPTRTGTVPNSPRKPAAINVTAPTDPPPPPPANRQSAPQRPAEPAPTANEPAPTASEPAPTASEPAPSTEPASPNGGGTRRNCNSKNSSTPC